MSPLNAHAPLTNLLNNSTAQQNTNDSIGVQNPILAFPTDFLGSEAPIVIEL